MNIPTTPLRHLAEVLVSNVDKKSLVGQHQVRLCNYTDVYYSDVIRDDREFMAATASPNQIQRFRLRVGDTVITKDSELPDDIAVPAYVAEEAPDLLCGYHLAILRPRRTVIEPRYLAWATRSDFCRDQFAVEATGVTRFGLKHEAIRRVSIPTPPLQFQHRVADFLDGEVARLDAIVQAKQAFLDSHDERLDAQILGAIGESGLTGKNGPVHEIRRLLMKRRTPGPAGGELVTAFRDGQVTARALRRAQGYTEAWTVNATYQQVRRGDIVVHGLDGFAGAIGTSEADGICSPVYHVMQALDGGDPDFYGRLLRVLAVSGYLGLFATSTRERAVDFRNWDLFGRIPIPAVDLELQHQIGGRIRALRPLRAALASSRALTLERRRALITAVVTGEFDVSTASGRGVA